MKGKKHHYQVQNRMDQHLLQTPKITMRLFHLKRPPATGFRKSLRK